MNIFSDFNEPNAHGGATGDAYVEARVFQEQIIGAGDLGTTVDFDFEFKRNFELNTTDFGPTGNTNTFAYVRVLDLLGGSFATLAEVEFETTGAGLTNWTQQQISLAIAPNLNGQLLQFGFYSEAQDFNGSGIAYDDLAFTAPAAVPEPGSAAVLALLGFTMITRRRRKA